MERVQAMNNITNSAEEIVLTEIIDISTRQLQRIELDEDRTKIGTIRKIIKVLQIPDKDILDYRTNRKKILNINIYRY